MTAAEVSSPFIVRASRLRAEDEARAVVAAAEARAEAVRAEAEAEAARHVAALEAEAQARAEAAFAEARALGRAEAAAEAAALMARTGEAIDLFWREREGELRDLAFAVAHRVLSASPPDAVLLRLAAEAIAEHGRDARLALKVSPDMADGLRAALSELDGGGRVSVSSDPSLAPGDCTLLHPRGRTEIGLLAQFRSMLGGGGGGPG